MYLVGLKCFKMVFVWDNYNNYTDFWYVGTLNLLRWGQHPSDWDDMKSHGSPHIGEQFGDNLVGFWWGLSWFKRVLVVILDPSLQAQKSSLQAQ